MDTRRRRRTGQACGGGRGPRGLAGVGPLPLPSARGARSGRTTARTATAWDHFPHDHARSRAYRWSEDGLAGVCDSRPDVLPRPGAVERRRPGPQGARRSASPAPRATTARTSRTTGGTSTRRPRTRGCRWRYHYPQREFPYADLVAENARRGPHEPEYELVDTGVFDDDRFWAVQVDYAKAGPTDLLMRVTVDQPRTRRGHPARAADPVVPQHLGVGPARAEVGPGHHGARRATWPPGIRPLGTLTLNGDGSPDLLFCDNETNAERLYGTPGRSAFPKDGINDHVVHGAASVNPDRVGTKAAAHHVLSVPRRRRRTRSGCGSSPASSRARWRGRSSTTSCRPATARPTRSSPR